jgi:hypothetical protein
MWLMDLFHFCTGSIATIIAGTAPIYSNIILNKAAVGVVAPAAVI